MKKILDKATSLIWKPFNVLLNHPVVLHAGNINIVGFGIFAALETAAISTVFIWYLHAKDISFFSIPLFMIVICALSIWTGAKVFALLALGKKFWTNPIKYLGETGFYMQGGVLGAIVWLVSLSWISKISFSILADGLCLGALLGQTLGRLGCFNYGCCFGKPVKHGPGVRYFCNESKVLRWRPELAGVKLHPTQLYSSALNLLLFAVLWEMIPVGLPNGIITLSFLIWHGITRIAIEHLRRDIIHHEGRNWITFITAGLLAFSTPLIHVVLQQWDSGYFQKIPVFISFTIPAMISFVFSNTVILFVVSVTSLLVFAGYGVHGEKLGTFPHLFNFHSSRRGEFAPSTVHAIKRM